MWMDVDVALAEVPVNLVALIDSTDFITREESVTYNQAGMDLVWNFVTTAGAYTQTAVVPTTAGLHDWASQGNAMYSIEIPASGGTINNDTEGFGWFTGFATGVLPWTGPVIGFRAAGLNNLMIDSAYSATRGLAGNALPTAAANAAGGLPTSAAGALALDTQLANTHEVTAARMSELDAATGGKMANQIDEIRTDTGEIGAAGAGLTAINLPNQTMDITGSLSGSVGSVAGHTNQTGDSFARLGAPAGASVSADIAAVEGQTDDIGVAGAGLTAVPYNTDWNADIQSECADALVAIHLDHLLAANYDPAAKPGVATALLNELIENDAGVSRYTANALEQAPTGGSAPTVGEIADQVWEEAQSDHVAAGSFGEIATEIAAVPTVTQIQAEMEENGASILDTLQDRITALIATKAEMDTAHALLATVAKQDTAAGINTEVRLAELAAANLPADVDILITRITAAVATATALATTDGKVDTINTNAARLTAERAAVLTDWINGERLDLLLDAIKAKTDNLPESLKRNTAVAHWPIYMRLAVDHVSPAPGLTVTGQRTLDGGALAGMAGAIVEIGSGWYDVQFAAADLDSVVAAFLFDGGVTADKYPLTVKTEP